MADTADRLPKVEDFQELVERKAAIRKLLKAVNIKDLNIDKRTCLMCREDYRERVVRKLHDQDEDEVDAPQPERVVSLPCTHVFGKTCVMEWLMRYGSCPWCQAVHLAPGEGFTYQDYQEIYRETVAWPNTRAKLVAELQAKAEAAATALEYLEAYTIPTVPPARSQVYVAYQIAVRPRLLTDEKYSAARYYKHRIIYSIDELAKLIRADLANFPG